MFLCMPLPDFDYRFSFSSEIYFYEGQQGGNKEEGDGQPGAGWRQRRGRLGGHLGLRGGGTRPFCRHGRGHGVCRQIFVHCTTILTIQIIWQNPSPFYINLLTTLILYLTM